MEVIVPVPIPDKTLEVEDDDITSVIRFYYLIVPTPLR
jgi:hypothetical protein